MSDFCELWPGGPVFRQSGHFRLGTDSVLLADFVNTSSLRRGIDLGCGSGAIALLLLARDEKLKMTGLEILPDAADIARTNLSANPCGARGGVVTGDIRESRRLFKSGEFDLAVSNPPYFASGSGLSSPSGERAAAREESACTLSELCSAAAFLLRTGGGFFVVYRPERLAELFCAMAGCGIEPKRLRMVQNTAFSAPSLVLAEGRRGGRTGLRMEPPLILHGPDGGETDEYRRIYHISGEA